MMRYQARPNLHGFEVFDMKVGAFCLDAWSSREDEAARWAEVLNAQYAKWLADTSGLGEALSMHITEMEG